MNAVWQIHVRTVVHVQINREAFNVHVQMDGKEAFVQSVCGFIFLFIFTFFLKNILGYS